MAESEPSGDEYESEKGHAEDPTVAVARINARSAWIVAAIGLIGAVLVAVIQTGGSDSPPPPASVAPSDRTADDEATEESPSTTQLGVDGLSRGDCDAAAWAAAAQAYIEERGLEVGWSDPDADCLTTEFEINSSGTDPSLQDQTSNGIVDGVDPIHVQGGLIPTLGEQLNS